MTPGAGGLPDARRLARGLAAVFGVAESGLAVHEREPNARKTTFPGEFVRCTLPDGRRLELFIKYGDDVIDTCYGHRGNVAYEAAIYRRLRRAAVPGVPEFHGAYAEPGAGRTWLVIERVWDDGRINEHLDTARAMREAARWLGRFHAMDPEHWRDTAKPRVRRHGPRYFTGWIHRTVRLAAPLHATHPWLAGLGRCARELVAPLLDAPVSLIHGEFYPHNVLVDGAVVHAIDWQSAAIAAGELDLAALIDRWPDPIAADCEREYREARWPDGAPDTFAPALHAARIHWQCRWLGDRAERTLDPRFAWRFEALRREIGR